MKYLVTLAFVVLILGASLVAYFGTTPDVAYQTHHISDGAVCAVLVYGDHEVVLEDRTDCGGFLTPVVRFTSFLPGYVACMADVQEPALEGVASWERDAILWYGGYELWDTAGHGCDGYLQHMPDWARGRATDFGRLVRRDAIQMQAP